MANKKTVVQMYEEILPLCVTEEQRTFIKKRIEITKKKNAGGGENAKPTKTQLENEGIKNTIIATLADYNTPISISDLMKANAELGQYSNQKITSLLTQLHKANFVVRSEVKGKAYYAIVQSADNAGEE